MAEAGRKAPPDVVAGKKTGAAALVATLKAEGVPVVFGIPGAQENELWDEMKSQCLPYLLVTHEMSAAYMADGVARSTGRPGVIAIVPGPGVTNSLSGLGEALLDSVPIVAIVGDVARGDKYRPFQVHELPQVGLLQQVCKGVFEVSHACEIPNAVHQAFRLALCGEPGPTAVVVPYTLLIDTCKYDCPPLAPCDLPFDEGAFLCAWQLLRQRGCKVGIYAGMGCMDYGESLTNVAEVLQAPVATSVSGKGVISECHPLAVGWGYGPQGTRAAENAFKKVDIVLAIGVRYSEVSTAFYSIPQSPHIIHVDINPANIGRILKTEVCVNADAGVFLTHLLEHADEIRRPPNNDLVACIRKGKHEDACENAKCYARCGVDPMAFILALRKATGSERPGVRGCVVFGALGRRGVHGLPAAHLLQPDRQPGDGLVDPRRHRRAARPLRSPGGDDHRRRLFPDDGDRAVHGGARGTAGQVLHSRRSGVPLHAGVAGQGVSPHHGDDAGAPGLRRLGEGVWSGVYRDQRAGRSVRRHPRRAGASGSGAGARRHRLRQTSRPLARRHAQTLH